MKALAQIKNPLVHKHKSKPVVQHLLAMVELRIMTPQMDMRGKGYKYACPEHWSLEHGLPFDYQHSSELLDQYDLERGEIKMCYANSFAAAEDNPEVVVYVEGYASTIIPFPHSWNTFTVEKPGTMVDLTLRVEARPRGYPVAQYWGTPFDLDYVTDILEEKGEHNVINHWQADWPLLQNDRFLDEAIHEDWR